MTPGRCWKSWAGCCLRVPGCSWRRPRNGESIKRPTTISAIPAPASNGCWSGPDLPILTSKAGGGFFTLLGRRLLDSILYFQGGWRWLLFLPAAAVCGVLGVLLPMLDFLDPTRNTTLGYVCTARKPGPEVASMEPSR